MSKKYLSCAETAKLVRAALKARYPLTKFSVRSKTYSGGASIDVSWTDGPTDAEVEAITFLYKGANFDGMIDLKTYVTSILVDENGNPEEVRFGADFIFTQRALSPEFRAECEAIVAAGTGLPYADNDYYDVVRLPDGGFLRGGPCYGSGCVHRVAWDISKYPKAVAS